MEKKLLSIGQAAEILGVSVDTLRRWDKSGKLIAARESNKMHRYYREEDIEIFKSDLFKLAHEWIKNKTILPNTFYCQTSSIFQARLIKMEMELMKVPGFEKLYSLIVLITGEIGDNSFAHNLGNWPDIPGIFFGYDINKRIIVLADRGLGILETLRHVRPKLSNHAEALKIAFTEFISGRAPEKRGNGLKLVREIVSTQPISLLFMSGDAILKIKDPQKEFNITTDNNINIIHGCLVKITF